MYSVALQFKLIDQSRWWKGCTGGEVVYSNIDDDISVGEEGFRTRDVKDLGGEDGFSRDPLAKAHFLVRAKFHPVTV